jgi:hypothetical protein
VHRWNTGIEIRPALISLSVAGKENNTFKYPKIDERPNHLDGDMKNEILSGWITDAIENYENGKILDYTIDVEKLWND